MILLADLIELILDALILALWPEKRERRDDDR